ncbi:MAG TPA: NAD(P)H-binding protein [Planctomycetota bacterium]|nr:NAD(P)H-binding protein [Planctomycetota bacterium]
MSPLHFERAAIVGATGPTGSHLADALLDRSIAVRAISRSEEGLRRTFAGRDVELTPADALDAAGLARAVHGCDLVVDCIGLPPDAMDRHAVAARNVARAAAGTGARMLHVSSYWAYLPLVRSPLDEDHPREGGSEWVRHRRAAEDVLLDAGAAVLHLPDFYGPRVHTSTLQSAIVDAVLGRTMNWLGRADVAREYVFVADAMRIASDVVRHEAAFGKRWIVPGAGPLRGSDVVRIVGELLGARVKLRTAGPFLLRLVSVFQKELRGFLQMVPEYVKPVAFDASRLRALVGEVELTDYRSGIARTVEWLRARS